MCYEQVCAIGKFLRKEQLLIVHSQETVLFPIALSLFVEKNLTKEILS